LSRREKGDPLWTNLQLAKRKIFIPDEFRVQARTTAEELRKVATLVAQKLNQAKGPVKFLIPSKGWSTLSVEGADLCDRKADAAFGPALRERLRPGIEVSELPMELNSAEFAEAIVGALEGMMKESTGN
jgi:uncharacterized protein (UPF0261 family)